MKTISAITIALFYASSALGQVSSGSGMASAVGMAGAGLSAGVAAYEGSQCGSSNKTACLMAVMAMNTAVSEVGSAISASGTQSAADAFNPDMGAVGDLSTTNVPGLTPAEVGTLSSSPDGLSTLQQLQNAESALQAAGVTTSPDGSSMTLPGGGTVPTNQGMGVLGSVGVSPQQIAATEAQAKKIAQKIASKYSVSGVALANSPGPISGSDSSSKLDLQPLRPFDFNHHLQRMPTSVAGMAKSFHGDPIGVAQDGIFDMIMRRYQAEQKAHAFLDK